MGAGQSQLATIRVAIAGLGKTGSHIAQQLAYVGIPDFVLIDPDAVDLTNLNRLVGAVPADLSMVRPARDGAFDTPKVYVLRRLIKQIAPEQPSGRSDRECSHPTPWMP